MILDAQALIDFHWLDEWVWLKYHYSPLYISQEVLNWKQLRDDVRISGVKHLQLLTLDSDDMYKCYRELFQEFAPISPADCSTLVIAKKELLLCGTDEGKIISICKDHKISYTCTFMLLRKMVETQYKSSKQVLEITNYLIEKRGKWIRPQLLEKWKKQILEI